MSYFLLDTLADRGRGEFCFMSDEPRGVGASTYRLAEGEPLRDVIHGEVALEWGFGADYPGLKLSSFLGNSGRFFAVHRDVSDLVVRHRVGDLEIVPLVVYDHRGRIRSKDYVFLNPIGSMECLNLDRSVVRRDRAGDVLDVQGIVLDRKRLAEAGDLFRIREVPSRYVLSDVLVGAIQAQAFTNFVFRELDVE